MPSFIVVGQTATAAGAFSLDDLAGSSGRLDVLLRCVRAALLCSHTLRRDVVVYLLLLGGPEAPRVWKIDGAHAKFVRPDERPLATLLKKSLSSFTAAPETGAFVAQRHGIAVAAGGLEAIVGDIVGAKLFLLEEGGTDIRDLADQDLKGDAAFFIGDHLGIEPAARERIVALGGRPVSVGPESLHSDDVVTLVTNELDRRRARRAPSAGL